MRFTSTNLKTALWIGLITLMLSSCNTPEGKHLFILSGQSNMALLKPEESFTPTVEEAFGTEDVIVVKDALGGAPIHRWYKEWKSPNDSTIGRPDLYDSLITKVKSAIEDQKIQSITLLWMQGERDARMSWGEVYLESLQGLYDQLSQDLNRTDINFVIGRLSDFDLDNTRYPHWQMVREAHMQLADSKPRFDWINTDDLNDGQNRAGKEISNDLHMSGEGYITMGKRFAEKAIELIRK